MDDSGDKFLSIPFQRIDMGGVAGYLVDMWYFGNQTDANSAGWKENMAVAQYTYTIDGKIETATIPVFDDRSKVSVGIESDYTAMGKQRATLLLDYSKIIKEVTGAEVEQEKQVDIPTIDAVLSADGDAMSVTIQMPSASDVQDADIYYVISESDEAAVEQTEGNKYIQPVTITKESAVAIGGAKGTVNVLAIAVKDGYTDSIVNVKKLTFNTDSQTGGKNTGDGEIDVTKDGKYWVNINLYKASDDEPSMGNVAFDNNRQALIITSGGESVIQMGSNPVRIDPYYSGLQEFQFRNAQGVYQLATTLETQEIKTTYNGTEYTFDYLKKFQFTLPRVTEEMLDVKVKVPYTIMDSSVGDGAIDARLKIEWDTLSLGGAGDELHSNSSDSRGSVSITSDAVDVTDTATGIRLLADENILPSGAILSAEEVKEGSSFELARKVLAEDAARFTLYSVHAKTEGVEVTPYGKLKLYFPIPADYDEERVGVYRINSDATKTLVRGTVTYEGTINPVNSTESPYYVLETETLGLFAIAETEEILNAAVTQEEQEPEEELFSDISGHWAKEYIKKAVEKGLFSGISNTAFGPDLEMTRGMFVTVLGRMDGINPKAYRGNKFSDVEDKDYFSSYVLWAAEEGIISGMADGTFAPDANITREQMAVILAKYAEIKRIALKNEGKAKFNDSAKINSWAKDGVESLAQAKILHGRDGSFDPQETASRADVAAMLVGFMEEYMPEEQFLDAEEPSTP